MYSPSFALCHGEPPNILVDRQRLCQNHPRHPQQATTCGLCSCHGALYGHGDSIPSRRLKVNRLLRLECAPCGTSHLLQTVRLQQGHVDDRARKPFAHQRPIARRRAGHALKITVPLFRRYTADISPIAGSAAICAPDRLLPANPLPASRRSDRGRCGLTGQAPVPPRHSSPSLVA